MKAARVLKRELENLYYRKKIEPRDVLFIFGKVREILEHRRKYKSQYPQLNLFCNWCFHTALKDSKTIYRYLLEVSIALSEASNTGSEESARITTENFIKVGANILNIPKLRVGLKAVLSEQGIETTICDNREWWNAFVQLLLHEVSEKPLHFPDDVVMGDKKDGNAYKFFSQILQLPNQRGFDKVIRIEINLEERVNIFQLHFTTIGNVVIVVDLQGREEGCEFVL